MKRMRLDDLLIANGLVPSKDDALRHVLSGKVLVNDKVMTSPGATFPPNASIRIKQKESAYVSRGGDKLERFLQRTPCPIRGTCCLDIGISTGGFTNVLLEHGAAHVCGVDVGYGILDFSLRKHPNVSLLERTNARYLTQRQLNDALAPFKKNASDIAWVVMDVSFISVFKIVPTLMTILPKSTRFIVLIKPQFEATKAQLGATKGILDKHYVNDVLTHVEHQFNALHLTIHSTMASDIKGRKGNQEFFYCVSR
ncbi:MAG: TlyA family RNA methyltransferase [Candidatus Margulisbacteria bacterium]|nr:TlyA family RNA methyltransferase [Candidatus Margulisiibacteriota bacterium]